MHFGHGSKLSVVDTETEGEPGLMVKSHGAFCVLRNREMTGKLVTRALQLDRARAQFSLSRFTYLHCALHIRRRKNADFIGLIGIIYTST